MANTKSFYNMFGMNVCVCVSGEGGGGGERGVVVMMAKTNYITPSQLKEKQK